MKPDNTIRNATIISVALIFLLILLNVFVGPIYNVWSQSLAGKAELQKAEYTRQVAVLEAQAKKDSATQLAEAEIIRAKGVSSANKIIGDSLKGNPEYLQYLYIVGMEEGSKNGNTTIYVPTEGGLPIPTLQMNKSA